MMAELKMLEGKGPNKAKFDAKWKRITDAIALKEPDTVPFCPVLQCYPFIHAGYTMADILYDVDGAKATESMLRFVAEYDPDLINGHDYVNIGQGPIFELQEPKTTMWAGMPGGRIDDNSIHQHIEFPILEDEEFDEFAEDPTLWLITKGIPREAGVFDVLRTLPLRGMRPMMGMMMAPDIISAPPVREMIERLWKIAELSNANKAMMAKLTEDLEYAGYPCPSKAMAAVPFDGWSDFMRGTIGGLTDLYENPAAVRKFCDQELEATLGMLEFFGQVMPGRFVFMALHKGMDGFMSDEQYRSWYWDYLQKIIVKIIEVGLIPYIYTEGKYDTRIECLKEVPAGKVFYHFEEVDMAAAKKALGGTACIGGGFSPQVLDRYTPEVVRERVKRLLDDCAPGGGFIFETSYGMDYCKPENVEALVETVRECGKY